MLRGVDVSDWQPDIDWTAVAGAGWSFAIVKATEGTGNVQYTFEPYRSAIPGAGMGPVGIYHFARPETGNPESQADHYCDVVGSIGADEFAVLDVETGDQSTWPDFILRWFARVEARMGHVARCVYMSDSPAGAMPSDLGDIPLWDAAYGPNTGTPPAWGTGYQSRYNGPFEHSWDVGPWDTWTIWQYSSKGSVPGIDGNVDVNLAPDDLRARLGINTPKPVPVPTPPAPPQEDDMATPHILLSYGSGVALWHTSGDVVPLATSKQVTDFLGAGAIVMDDLTAEQIDKITGAKHALTSGPALADVLTERAAS